MIEESFNLTHLSHQFPHSRMFGNESDSTELGQPAASKILHHRVVCWLMSPSLIPKLPRFVCKRRNKEGRTGLWMRDLLIHRMTGSKMASSVGICGVPWLLELCKCATARLFQTQYKRSALQLHPPHFNRCCSILL